VFNHEECMNNEFLRPRVNSCKWFNDLGVMRKCVYIEKGGKCKISAKNNRVNWLTYYLNRFRQLNDKPDEQWRLIRIRHKLNRFKSPQMKIDTIQTLMNRFNQSQRVLWYDSKTFESIQARKRWKIDAVNIWIDSHVNRFKKTVNRFTMNLLRKTVNRFTTILFRKTVNRFTAILFRTIWLDSKGVTQEKWTKGMLDMNQWFMNQIKQLTEWFSIYDNTRDIKGITWHNETWFARVV